MSQGTGRTAARTYKREMAVDEGVGKSGRELRARLTGVWIPAFAGMTVWVGMTVGGWDGGLVG